MDRDDVVISPYMPDPTEGLVEVSVGGRRLALLPVPAGQVATARVSEAHTVWFWAGSLLWTWNRIATRGVVASCDIGDQILDVVPRDSSSIVVAETAVKVVSEDLRTRETLLDHNEVLVRFQRRDKDLVVWDFQGNSVVLPGLFS